MKPTVSGTTARSKAAPSRKRAPKPQNPAQSLMPVSVTLPTAFAKWAEETRALVKTVNPSARWASLVVNHGDGRPSSVIVVIPNAADQ
ncbi:MAG: hypothetical protein C0467_07105 [Planctomycetaceae bacterium]|nr:hypothetical protein [Planctomycetaceae bacterium]